MFRQVLIAVLTVTLLTPLALWAVDPPSAESVEARVPDYVKALKSKNAEVRKQVALALGDLGGRAKAAVPALREALLDADEAVQAAAAKALGQIDSENKDAEKPDGALIEEVKKFKEALEKERLVAREREVALKEALARSEADRAFSGKIQDELAARANEARRLNELLKASDARAAESAAKATQLQAQVVQSQVEAEQLRKRAAALEERLIELEKAPKPSDKEPVPGKPTPPPGNVKGEVSRVDETTGLIVINIGSDAGLDKGQTLECFRLKPDAKYLGQLKIIDVNAKEAVARVTGRAVAPIAVGDQVAGKILGNDK